MSKYFQVCWPQDYLNIVVCGLVISCIILCSTLLHWLEYIWLLNCDNSMESRHALVHHGKICHWIIAKVKINPNTLAQNNLLAFCYAQVKLNTVWKNDDHEILLNLDHCTDLFASDQAALPWYLLSLYRWDICVPVNKRSPKWAVSVTMTGAKSKKR